MINEKILEYSIQYDNITTTASRGQGGSRFEPQPKGYGMSQNHHFECPQATFDSVGTATDSKSEGGWLLLFPDSPLHWLVDSSRCLLAGAPLTVCSAAP